LLQSWIGRSVAVTGADDVLLACGEVEGISFIDFYSLTWDIYELIDDISNTEEPEDWSDLQN